MFFSFPVVNVCAVPLKQDGEDDGAETAVGKKNLQIFGKGDETPKVIRMTLIVVVMMIHSYDDDEVRS